MLKLNAWLPDVDATGEGVLTDVSNAIPTDRGYAGAPGTADAVPGLAALAAQARGMASLTNTAGTRRVFAGTQTKIYEIDSTSWTDRSRAGNYTGSAESRWTFDQFGDAAIASNGVEILQASTSGAFADISGAPVARAMFTTKDFVFALGYDTTLDGWRCSAFQDHTSWTTSTATQATSGRLVGAGGSINAGAKLGDYVVAYKNTAMYLGQYVGPPVVWQWQQLEGVGGCVGVDALCNVGRAHVFVGPDDIWIFDGVATRSIAGGVKETIFRNISPTYIHRTICRYDPLRDLVWIFYPAASSTTPDRCLIWHVRTGRWGKANLAAEAAATMNPPGLTFDTWDTVAATFDALPDAPYDSSLWSSGVGTFAIIDTAHELQFLNGISSGGSLTTGDIGSGDGFSMLRKSRLHTLTDPTSATAQGFYRNTAGGALSGGTSSVWTGNKFDHRQTGRWHRIVYSLTGPFEVSGFTPELVSAGNR